MRVREEQVLREHVSVCLGPHAPHLSLQAKASSAQEAGHKALGSRNSTRARGRAERGVAEIAQAQWMGAKRRGPRADYSLVLSDCLLYR